MIHLLAELIENATSLSPPFTQVRVGGETVANGFAIEIEDRGLGMTPQKLHELNERLANPPDINPANTEQLGLFVVGQLARRHGISVMLRPSPYGGTTAVALIPLALLVEEGPAAITAGGRAPAAGTAGPGGYRNGQVRRLPGRPGRRPGRLARRGRLARAPVQRRPRPQAPARPAPGRRHRRTHRPFRQRAVRHRLPFGTGSAYGDAGQAPATAGYPSAGMPGSGGYDRGHAGPGPGADPHLRRAQEPVAHRAASAR